MKYKLFCVSKDKEFPPDVNIISVEQSLSSIFSIIALFVVKNSPSELIATSKEESGRLHIGEMIGDCKTSSISKSTPAEVPISNLGLSEIKSPPTVTCTSSNMVVRSMVIVPSASSSQKL